MRLWATEPAPSISGYSANYGIGVILKVSAATTIRRIGFRRPQTGANARPLSMVLDREPLAGGTVTTYFDSANLTDSGAVGWQMTDLGQNVTLEPGYLYQVWGRYPSGTVWNQVGASSRPTPDAPLQWLNTSPSYYNTSGMARPYQSNDGLLIHHDVDNEGIEYEDPDPGEPPINADIDYQLADWLDLVAGTKANSAPLDTNARLRTLITNAESRHADIIGLVGGPANAAAKAGTTLFALLKYLAQHPDIAIAALASLTTIANNIQDMLTDRGPQDTLTDERIEYVLTTIGIDMARRNEAINEAWTLIDTEPFTGELAWDVPNVDRFILTVDTYGEKRRPGDVAGAPVLYRAGWWSPKVGTQFAQRYPVSFQEQQLWVPGTRMHGLLMTTWAEATGTVQAWRREVGA